MRRDRARRAIEVTATAFPPRPHGALARGPRTFNLRGYYGHLNTGDDALAAGCLLGLSGIAHLRSVSIHSSRPLWLPPSVLNASYLPDVQRFRAHSKWLGYWNSLTADCTVFGGGSLIHDTYGPGPLQEIERLTRLARIGRTRIAFLGIGVGPLTSSDAIKSARRIARNAVLFAVRDEDSARLCRDYLDHDPPVTDDLAMLLSDSSLTSVPVASRIPDSDRFTIGIAVCRFETFVSGREDTDDRQLRELVAALKAVRGERDVRFVLFTFNGHERLGDDGVNRSIREALGHETIVLPYSPVPIQVLNDVSRCDAMISMRLHAAIFGFMAEVPQLILSYHRKTEAFAGMAGYPSQAVLDYYSTDGATMAGRIRGMLSSRQDYLAGSPVATHLARAQSNFSLLRDRL